MLDGSYFVIIDYCDLTYLLNLSLCKVFSSSNSETENHLKTRIDHKSRAKRTCC